MYQNPKSATTAGLLGIFLGGFGAHNWYLGEKNKGIAHVCMMGAGLLVEIIANIVLPNALSWSALLTMAGILAVLGGIAGLAMTASGIWGLVEGIQILVGGDAGLAAKGYVVANPAAMQQNMAPGYAPQGYYGQPMPMNGQMMGQQPMPGQPMNQPMPQMAQPMPQAAPQQPMGNGTPMNNMPVNNAPTQDAMQGMNAENWNNGGMNEAQNGQQ